MTAVLKGRSLALLAMMIALGIVFASLLIPATVKISAQGVVSDAVFDAIGSEMITVSTTAIGISAGVLTVGGVAADKCFITTEAQPLRWTTSGTTPTSSVGHLAAAGTTITLMGRPDLAAFRMIRQGASDASVAVTCSRLMTP